MKSEVELHKFIDRLLNKMETCSNEQQQKAAHVVNDIKTLLPACSVYTFGSRVTGIATSKSDLDLYIDIGKLNSFIFSIKVL